MMRRAQILLSFIAGLVGGYVIGGWQLAPMLHAPPRVNDGSGLGQAADLAAAPTPVDAALADMLAGRRDRRRILPAARPAEAPPQGIEVLMPATAGEDLGPDQDASLISRGPGHFALLDLSAAGISVLTIRQGSMARDGDGRFAPFARQPKVGLLRGSQVRVELLHLGFDAEGQPAVAHIRTTTEPPVEGVVSLVIDDRHVVVRPAPPRPPVATDAGAEASGAALD